MKYILVAFLTLVTLSSQTLLGQKVTPKTTMVSGIVLNADEAPVKKALIFLDSMQTKIKTDKKGQFKISLKPENKIITAYSWKYGVHTVVYNEGDEIRIVFPKTDIIMSEDQLTALGFKLSKKVRKKKEPKDYSKYLNMYDLIAMEVPGAIVNNGVIRLRGNAINSVNSGQEPLIMVDGTVVGSIEYILPREVASVQVIRDEGASLYGARGANGVILIKMKH